MLTVYPPHDFNNNLTKHQKLLVVLEDLLRKQWSPYMSPRDLEHNIDEIVRLIRYNKDIKALLEE